ncbi:MAG: glucose-6-phosphate dehydrogenase, partial [Deltaproteobacteria bacterium]|nr:glucose-6-phosphate dehydrogenase [Deltaproteobacteria bacterium]
MNTEKQELDSRQDAVVTEGRAVDPGVTAPKGLLEKQLNPCAIVIVGASGDLTARKILPALFNLYLSGGLPDLFLVIGCGRTELSHDAFREKMMKAVTKAGNLDQSKWQSFARCLFYRSIDYHDLPSFTGLAEFLQDLDKKYKTGGNRIFYLAIPPALYQTVAQMIGRSGLAVEQENSHGWSRLV